MNLIYAEEEEGAGAGTGAWTGVGLPIYIQKKLYPITYKGFDFISYNL